MEDLANHKDIISGYFPPRFITIDGKKRLLADHPRSSVSNRTLREHRFQDRRTNFASIFWETIRKLPGYGNTLRNLG